MNNFKICDVVISLVEKANDWNGMVAERVVAPKGSKGMICEINPDGTLMVQLFDSPNPKHPLFDYLPEELKLIRE